MPRILVCQHVPFEILGTFNPLLKAHKFRIKYVNFGRHPDTVPCVKGYDGLVLLGGPISAYEDDLYPHIKTEVKLVKDALDKGIPVLGICLGAQIVARALGANVCKNPCPEIGWYDVSPTQEGLEDPLIKHFEKTRKIFQWHGDCFEIPEQAVHLASSSLCNSQAFRYRDNVYGFQFHLEVDQPLIERWLTVPAHQAELEALKDTIKPSVVRQETGEHIEQAMKLSNNVFVSFIRLITNRAHYPILPSR